MDCSLVTVDSHDLVQHLLSCFFSVSIQARSWLATFSLLLFSCVQCARSSAYARQISFVRFITTTASCHPPVTCSSAYASRALNQNLFQELFKFCLCKITVNVLEIFNQHSLI